MPISARGVSAGRLPPQRRSVGLGAAEAPVMTHMDADGLGRTHKHRDSQRARAHFHLRATNTLTDRQTDSLRQTDRHWQRDRQKHRVHANTQ